MKPPCLHGEVGGCFQLLPKAQRPQLRGIWRGRLKQDPELRDRIVAALKAGYPDVLYLSHPGADPRMLKLDHVAIGALMAALDLTDKLGRSAAPGRVYSRGARRHKPSANTAVVHTGDHGGKAVREEAHGAIGSG